MSEIDAVLEMGMIVVSYCIGESPRVGNIPTFLDDNHLLGSHVGT